MGWVSGFVDAPDLRGITLFCQDWGGLLGLRPADLIGSAGITERDMRDYQPPSTLQIDTTAMHAGGGIEAHFLGQYLPWDAHANARMAASFGMVGMTEPVTPVLALIGPSASAHLPLRRAISNRPGRATRRL